MKNVLIIYKFLPQYRVDFFNKLRIALQNEGINLKLVYGKLKNKDSLKNDEVDLDWADFVPNKVINIGKTQLIWQPCLKMIRKSDLVIVEQANKLLLNYYLMFSRHFNPYRFAHWGHGRNMQENPNSVKNKFKFLFLGRCDWWFAYTEGVKEMLMSYKYPESKITVVQNAIDTNTLRNQYAEITDDEIKKIRESLNIKGENVAIYCGGMYPEKKLDMIIQTCIKVQEQIKDFHMIFIGSGIDSYKADEAANKYPFIHYLGPKFGKERVKYFKLASVQIMPGLVGLGILDSFALETPIITTNYPFHSPEIEYLDSGKNGVITADSPEIYTGELINILKNKRYKLLIEGCIKSAGVYTVEQMVDNFKKGVIKCIG